MLTQIQMPTWVSIFMNFQIVQITYFKTVIYTDQACKTPPSAQNDCQFSEQN